MQICTKMIRITSTQVLLAKPCISQITLFGCIASSLILFSLFKKGKCKYPAYYKPCKHIIHKIYRIDWIYYACIAFSQ